ncbi:MAG: Gfo/Idh/MocA family oxidoreductase [Chloroherpetonaceae bacterium]|nr:Gfo/Idh/MocA family oxidoreductase [Chthonomonadaceae bacterium]MDW8207112.1 Gfo/Idh/MocA family oxidoreductase [Chloroherpetonaceae bacterium]
MSEDPRSRLREALQEIRNALSQARESVVLLVMRRNKVYEEVQQLERRVTDLEQKARLADQINNPALAAEIRAERDRCAAELEHARARLAEAEAEAEAAKANLPRQEAQLQQQASELDLRLRQMETTRSSAEAEDLWSRATEKVRQLQHEADARAELAGRPVDPVSPAGPTPEQSAEEMLRALESQIEAPRSEPGSASTPNEPGAQAGAPATSMRYIELDAPVDSEPAPPSPEPADRIAAPPDLPAPPPAVQNVPPVAPHAPLPSGLVIPRQPVSEPRENVQDATATTEPVTPATAEPLPPPPSPPEDAPASEISRSSQDSTQVAQAPAGAAPIIRTQTQKEHSRMEPEQRVRVAAIGTGSIFRGAHLPVYPDIPQAQLVAFCDPDPEAHRLTRARYQSLMFAKIEQARERKDTDTAERLERDLAAVRFVHDISEVIEEIRPDLVDICTQPFLHVPLSIRALEAGIHVMCEKPISRSWLEAERLIATVHRTGKLYQHNENWLWDRDYYTAKKLVDAGVIGEPVLMFLATAHGGPEGAGKFWNPEYGGGGALLDNGIHAIGASWYISGLDKRPTLVKAAEPFGMSIRMPNRIIDGRFQKVTVDDDAHILIRFEHPQTGAWATAHVEGSWSHRDSPDTAIIGTTGKILFQNDGDRRFAVVYDAYDREARRIEVSGPTWQHWPSSFYGEILNMVECIRNNTPSISTAEFGAECSAIVGATYLSEKNGRRAVHVDEFKAFARDIAARYPDDPAGADNALIDALLAAVRR